MSVLQQMTAAPVEIELGGRKMRLHPLRERDYAEFEAWVAMRYMEVASKSISLLPEGERTAAFERAMQVASSLTLMDKPALKLMASIPGAVKLVWLGLRQAHDDVTEEMIFEWLTLSPKALTDAMVKTDFVNGLGKDEGESKKEAATGSIGT